MTDDIKEDIEIKNKLSKVFGENVIKTITDIGSDTYEATLDVNNKEKKIHFKASDLEKTENLPNTGIKVTYSNVITNEMGTAIRITCNKDPNFSFFTINKMNSVDGLSCNQFCIVNFNNTEFFINKDSGIIDKNDNKIEDKKILSDLKKVIEENLIKTESLLNGNDMVVASGVAETYEILLNQINNLNNSTNIGSYYIDDISLQNNIKDISSKNQFEVNNINISMELPLEYQGGFFTLINFFKLLIFIKDNGDNKAYEIGKKLKEYINKYSIKYNGTTTILETLMNIKEKINMGNDELKKQEFQNFFMEAIKVCNFKIDRDGIGNSIKHAANVVFSKDGRKYLIDSSLADYKYLFIKDLACNGETEREYNIDLFDTQKKVPDYDLAKIYSIQEGGCCKLWSVFLNVETNKVVRDNPDKDPIKVIDDNFDEIFLNASMQMSELIDKKKVVLFEKPIGSDENLYKPYQFNDKIIYVLTTDDPNLKSKCVRVDVLINMIHKHEVEKLLKEEIIRDSEVIEHDKFQQLHNLLNTMEKNNLNVYVKSVKDRILEQNSLNIDSLNVLENEEESYQDKTIELEKAQHGINEEFVTPTELRPELIPLNNDIRNAFKNADSPNILNDTQENESNKQKTTFIGITQLKTSEQHLNFLDIVKDEQDSKQNIPRLQSRQEKFANRSNGKNGSEIPFS